MYRPGRVAELHESEQHLVERVEVPAAEEGSRGLGQSQSASQKVSKADEGRRGGEGEVHRVTLSSCRAERKSAGAR